MLKKLEKVLSPDEYEVLRLSNIPSLDFIINTPIRDLHALTNLPYKNLEDIIKKTSAVIGPKFVTAFDLPEWEKLSTGCKAIDFITKGGIPFNGINEIVGCSGVGKTQLCLQLSIMCQLPLHLNGKQRGVVYINTEKPFPSFRFNELVECYKEKYNIDIDLQKNVFLQHISNYSQIKKTLHVLLPNFLTYNDVGLIIIDSIAGIFRTEEEDVVYTNRTQQFIDIVTKLNQLSKSFNICIVCVNHVTDNLNTSETVPGLGLSWTNLVNCRFNLTRFEGTYIRQFEIIFSPHLENNSCNFIIEAEGICCTDI